MLWQCGVFDERMDFPKVINDNNTIITASFGKELIYK
jgi:hypothetical protein